MYVYNYGSIGKAIRTKIDNFKQQVRGNTDSNVIFSDVLKAQLNFNDTEKKVVSATGNATLSAEKTSSLDGRTILYAIQNSDEDTTASAVLSAFGLSGSAGTNDLRDAADNLKVSAEQLIKANTAGGDLTLATADFVENFNKLSTRLSVENSSSAYLYKNAFGALLNSSTADLKEAGITAENGLLTYTGGKGQIPQIFLSNIVSTSAMVSSYAQALSSAEDTGVSEYYNTLISSMM